jgi:hypothetical protein
MKTNRSIALLGVLLCVTCSYAARQARVARPSEAEEAAAAARATLARLPSETRLAEIKNERLRHAVQVTYHAVVELAENRDSGKVAGLNAKFERAYVSVWQESTRGEHKTCAANCWALDGERCLSDCKATGRKFCGCRLIVFGCVVTECFF